MSVNRVIISVMVSFSFIWNSSNNTINIIILPLTTPSLSPVVLSSLCHRSSRALTCARSDSPLPTPPSRDQLTASSSTCTLVPLPTKSRVRSAGLFLLHCHQTAAATVRLPRQVVDVEDRLRPPCGSIQSIIGVWVQFGFKFTTRTQFKLRPTRPINSECRSSSESKTRPFTIGSESNNYSFRSVKSQTNLFIVSVSFLDYISTV